MIITIIQQVGCCSFGIPDGKKGYGTHNMQKGITFV